jgi:uncharacterized glyoxalase superfamily metalloenzyme YdcJ
LDEPRTMRLPDGSVVPGTLRVRFGEVEARGIALTREGRALYDSLLGYVDEQAAEHPEASRADLSREVWTQHLPATERALAAEGLAHFTYRAATDRPRDGTRPPHRIAELVERGWARAEPIVYEDFLPRSAAGIFQSNLSGRGSRRDDRPAAGYDADWLSGAVGRAVLDPFDLYESQQAQSVAQVRRELGLDGR